MNPTDLNRTLRQPQRYWNIDGLPLIGMGALWLFLGGYMLVLNAATRHPTGAGRVLALYGWAVVAAACFAISPILKRIKARITVPRAGYIRVSRQNYWAPRILGGAIGVVVACGTVIVLKYAQKHGFTAFERLLPAGVGVLIGGAFLFASRRLELPSYASAGLVALLAGLAVSVLTTSLDSFGWFWLVLGAACVVIGAIDLRTFLKAHPKPAGEEGTL
ncbi:MAG: hypothetical protein ACLQBJ_03825 [Bryobacteraceae bacterium]